MSYRRKTLRVMPPTTRKVARLIAEVDSISRKLKNVLPTIERQERAAIALFRRNKYYGQEEGLGHLDEGPDQPEPLSTVQG